MAVVLGIGVSGNVESFAKSVFDQTTLQKFSTINSVWLLVYFFILRALQTTGLLGVFIAYFIFYFSRVAIAIYTADSMSEHIKWRSIVSSFLPDPVESGAFISAAIICKAMMTVFAKRPSTGFFFCFLIACAHFAGFCYRRRNYIREFRTILKS